jgi:hypothetical protein
MFHFPPARWLVIAPLAAAAFSASGQTPTAPSANAGTAQAAPAVLTYRSALEGYQGFADEKAVPWKEANETVYRRGGWQAYAKEASGAGGGGTQGANDHAAPPPKKGQP